MNRNRYLLRITLLASFMISITHHHCRAQTTTIPVLNREAHPREMRQIAFIGDGKQFLTLAPDQIIRIWDTATGSLLTTFYPPLLRTSRENAIAVSEEGDRLLMSGIQLGSNQPVILSASLQTGKLLATRGTGGALVVSLGFVKGSNRFVFSTNRGDVQIGSADLNGPLVTLAAGDNLPKKFATSLASDRIVVVTSENEIRNFDINGKLQWVVPVPNRVQDIAFASSGNALAILSTNGMQRQRVELFDARTGELRKSQQVSFDAMAQKIEFFGDSGFFVAGRGVLGFSREFTDFQQLGTASEAEDWTDVVSVSKSGELFAIANRHGDVFIWANGERRGPYGAARPAISKVHWRSNSKVSWQSSFGESVSFSFEELRIVPEQPGDDSVGAIHARENVSLNLVNDVVIAKFNDGPSQPLALPNALGRPTSYSLIGSNLAVVGTSMGYLATFRLPQGNIERTLQGAAGPIRDMAVSQTGRYLVAGSDDATVRFWNLQLENVRGPQDPLLTISVRDKNWVAFTPEGYYAATPAGDDLLVWNHFASNSEMGTPWRARQFESRLFRPHVIASLLEQGSVAASVEMVSNVTGSPKTELLDVRTAAASPQAVVPPTVEWLEPQMLDVTTEKDKLKVKVRVSGAAGSSLSKVAFILNSRIVHVRSVNTDPVELEYEVPVPQEMNLLSVSAWDANDVIGESAVVTIHRPIPKGLEPITAAGKLSKPGMLYVVAVGVSEYRDKSHSLKYAHNDATDLTEALKKRQGSLYKDFGKEVVVNADANRETILDKLEWAEKSAKLQDTVVIIISAHGVRDAKQNYYLAPHDADFGRIFSTCIPWTTIVTKVTSIEANRVILFMDTCHAGGVVGAQAMQNDPIRELLSRRSPPIVYSSSEAGATSYENDAWKHGAFSKALLDSFADNSSDVPPQDGNLSILELPICVGRRVTRLTNGKQLPVYFNSGVPDFPLVKIVP